MQRLVRHIKRLLRQAAFMGSQQVHAQPLELAVTLGEVGLDYCQENMDLQLITWLTHFLLMPEGGCWTEKPWERTCFGP